MRNAHFVGGLVPGALAVLSVGGVELSVTANGGAQTFTLPPLDSNVVARAKRDAGERFTPWLPVAQDAEGNVATASIQVTLDTTAAIVTIDSRPDGLVTAVSSGTALISAVNEGALGIITLQVVLSWQLSNTMDVSFCLAALEEALGERRPEIFNTDQGSQFTAQAFTGRLEAAGVAISMDGRGRFLDNIFVERLWRTVKYEDLYIKGYTTVAELAAGLADYFWFYNHERPHQSLGYQTPAEVYFGNLAGDNASSISIEPRERVSV